MKRSALLSAIAAGALLLAGCGSQQAGTPSAASSPESPTSTAPSEQTSSATSGTAASVTGSSAATPTSESAPVTSASEPVGSSGSAGSSQLATAESSAPAPGGTELDETSTTWVVTFCTGFADIAEFTSPDTGMGKDETIQAVVDAYQGMADAASAAADALENTPAPTFAGGERMATGVHDWFRDVAEAYGDGAASIAAGDYDTSSDLKADIDAIETQVNTANARLGQTLGSVDPDVGRAIAAQPECAALAAGSGN
jgi:hypothetical protein